MTHFKPALKLFLLMTLLTGVIYPALITLISQLAFHEQANGSLLKSEDKIRGSFLIAQNFTEDKYFWPRPSAIDFDPLKPSGGSNLGPTSLKLKALVDERTERLGRDAPAELLFASASGLDPHISIETAYFQIPRIAQARNLEAAAIKTIVDSHVEGGLLGAAYVNVLQLNKVLDERR